MTVTLPNISSSEGPKAFSKHVPKLLASDPPEYQEKLLHVQILVWG